MSPAAHSILTSAASVAGDAELLHLRAVYHRIRTRRELQSRADRLAPAPEPVTKPAVPRKRHVGRWVDAPEVVVVLAAMAPGLCPLWRRTAARSKGVREPVPAVGDDTGDI